MEIRFIQEFSYAECSEPFEFGYDPGSVPVGPSPRNPVRVIRETEELFPLCRELLGQSVVGLDVETTLTDGSLCLVQLAAPDFTVVIDVLRLEDLGPLAVVFSAPETTKVIHNAPFERGVLTRYGFRLVNVFDTLSASRRLRGRRIGSHSLGAVCQRELGIKLNKVLQCSDWSRRPLSREQLKYAVMDAEVLLELHRRFSSEI